MGQVIQKKGAFAKANTNTKAPEQDWAHAQALENINILTEACQVEISPLDYNEVGLEGFSEIKFS